MIFQNFSSSSSSSFKYLKRSFIHIHSWTKLGCFFLFLGSDFLTVLVFLWVIYDSTVLVLMPEV